ncbi:MAG: hypothetical protein ACTSRI_19500 [Promethearchaeota archaeon]
MLKEFKVNEFITLKLENGETNIHIDGQLFNQCKFLLLEIPINEIISLDEIKSIDEAAEQLNGSLEHDTVEIPPEVEFWGHCSNLQVWEENNYDTRLLHANLAFPLLKKIAELGDKRAKIRLREEIVKRFKSGYFPTIRYLVEEGYLDYLTKDDFTFAFDKKIKMKDKIDKSKFLAKLLKSTLNVEEYNNLKSLEHKIGFKLKIDEYEPSLEKVCVEISNNNVTKLCLANLNLGTIPEEVRSFKSITHLDLYHCRLKEIPEWFSELTNL